MRKSEGVVFPALEKKDDSSSMKSIKIKGGMGGDKDFKSLGGPLKTLWPLCPQFLSEESKWRPF